MPGTYSSEPALTSLTVTPGTLGSAFNSYGFLYSVLDVPHTNDQITLNATAKTAYTISWHPAADADPNTDGHQVGLEVGYNSIFVSVDHDQGVNSFLYEVIVKRAGSSQQQLANTPATGQPLISGTARVGKDAGSGHVGDFRRRRPHQRRLHLPVACRRRRDRSCYRPHLHPGRSLAGQRPSRCG